jgi:hypothetical protein
MDVVVDPGPHLLLAPGVEGLAQGYRVDAVGVGVLVDEVQCFLGLDEGGGDTAAEVERGRADRVTHEEEPGQGEVAVEVLLAALVVHQRATGEDIGDGSRSLGVGPRRQAEGCAAGGLETRLVAEVDPDRVLGVGRTTRPRRAVLVDEDDDRVAVVAALPGNGLMSGPGSASG